MATIQAFGPGLHGQPLSNGQIAQISAQQQAEKRHEEHQYLDLIRDILERGEHRPDRQAHGFYLS